MAAWRVILPLNSPSVPSVPSSPVTNVQAVYAATISAREDAYTMTTADTLTTGCIDDVLKITDYYTPEILRTAYSVQKPCSTLNQAPQAPDIQTRPTLRGSVGRGKLRASRRSLLQTSSTSRARPLARSGPVRRCLKALDNLLTNTDIDASLRTQVTVDACVLMPTSIAASSHSSGEHSSSLHYWTSTEKTGSSPKLTRIKQQQQQQHHTSSTK